MKKGVKKIIQENKHISNNFVILFPNDKDKRRIIEDAYQKMICKKTKKPIEF